MSFSSLATVKILNSNLMSVYVGNHVVVVHVATVVL